MLYLREKRLGGLPDPWRHRENAEQRVHEDGGISSGRWSRALGAAGTARRGGEVASGVSERRGMSLQVGPVRSEVGGIQLPSWDSVTQRNIASCATSSSFDKQQAMLTGTGQPMSKFARRLHATATRRPRFDSSLCLR